MLIPVVAILAIAVTLIAIAAVALHRAERAAMTAPRPGCSRRSERKRFFQPL